MRLSLLAVGSMRGATEAPLYNDYASRIKKSGRAIGLDGLHLTEIKDHHDVAAKLHAAIDAHKGFCIFLDEGGENWTSRHIADRLGHWRDTNRGDALFVIGPADGLSDDLKARADITLSMGKMTWPHMLARVMLAEQLWRAISILTAHPYHRD
jgi:23S rRNA (pseudouridine1915-N3)-methyltransferase